MATKDEVTTAKNQPEPPVRDVDAARSTRRYGGSRRNDVEKAHAEAARLRVQAEEDRLAAEDEAKSPAQRKAEESARAADDARAAAMEAERTRLAENMEPDTVEDAKTIGYGIDPAMPAGDHMAQKFHNDPENPKLAPGLDPDEGKTVKLQHVRPGTEVVYTDVHPEMVGDYLRAGWSLAEFA